METARAGTGQATPLSHAEYVRVDRALRRLHESVRDFWGRWPVARRSASQLSRELGVDRTTCQRVASLAGERYAGPPMLEAAPGPRALRNLIQACDDRDCPVPPQTLAALRSAVDGFDEVVHECAGSVARLKRRLDAAARLTRSADPAADRDPQEALFHAARSLTRRHARATASVGLYDTFGVADGELRHLRISGNHGIVAEPDAVPMVLEAFDGTSDERRAGDDTSHAPGEGARSECDDPWLRTPTLLRQFTSAEWTTVELRPSPGFASRAMEIARSREPSDVYVYTAFPVPHPQTLDHPIEESWFILYSPTETLIFDLYLHESIARRCLVSLDIHLWQTSFANHPHGKWHTRMPQSPTIVQLGRGIGRAATPLHPLHEPITAELFRQADADPSEYIGFRCAEHFPIWRAGYRFELDFGRAGT